MQLSAGIILQAAQLCYACLLVSSELVVNTEDGSSTVTFGELAAVQLEDGYSFGTIISIVEDHLNPGGFLIGTISNIAMITLNKTIQILAGQQEEAGFRNGAAREAVFTTVQDITQYKNASELIITDSNNHCIRRLDRRTNIVTTFTGQCEQKGSITQPVVASDALLEYPTKAMYIEEKNIFYYLLRESILKYDLETDIVSLMYKSNDGSFTSANSFVMNQLNTFLYVSHIGGVWRFDTDTWESKLIVHSRESQARDQRGLAYLSGLAWLIPDQILILAYNEENELSVTNLEERTVSPICREDNSTNPIFVLNGKGSCKFNTSTMLAILGEDIIMGYMSTQQQGYLLRLKYSQPICEPPTLSHGWLTPSHSQYIHMKSVKFSCSTGYIIDREYNSIQCVAEYYRNGTVYGQWNKEAPICKRMSTLDSITPRQGQEAGGNRITLSGKFFSPAQISVEHNGFITEVTVARQNLKTIMFTMPSLPTKQNNTPIVSDEENTLTKIKVSFVDGITPTEFARTYIYLPDPYVMSQSRVGSLHSGGFQLRFDGNSLDSTYDYTFKLYENKGDNSSFVEVSCDRFQTVENVFCTTPNITENLASQLSDKVREDNSVTLIATLFGDGHPVNGAAERNFTITFDSPKFEPENSIFKYNVREELPLELKGTNFMRFLLVDDYRINLIINSRNVNTSCKVVRLEENRIFCQPINSELIDTLSLSEAETVTANVEVRVGNLFYNNVGNVELYLSDPEVNLQESTTSGSRTQIAILATAIVVPVGVVLIIAIIIFYKCRNRRHAKLMRTDMRLKLDYIDGETNNYCRVRRQLSVNLKCKLKCMYIDPQCLAFDRNTDLIGKGSFGKVYLGQLQCRGNILKSVAVKTLKETDDVSFKQVEEFLEEAAFLQNYDHVNILITLGVVWKKGDRPVAVLPYMAHGDLCSLIRRPQLTLTNGDLLHFGMQVSTGMEYLIEQRCLHRDLAARNCLVNDSYIVKIADFGMSKDVYSQNYYRESSKEKPKPVKWMALESLEEGVYNSSTEVWSFGVLMWELLTRGSGPYPGVNNCEILRYLRSGQRLSKPAYTCTQVFDAIKQCWDEDFTARPTFTQLREFLAECLGGDILNDILEEEFCYSYVQNFSKDIPLDYTSSYSIYRDGVQDIIYIDNDITYAHEDSEDGESFSGGYENDVLKDITLATSPNVTTLPNEYLSYIQTHL